MPDDGGGVMNGDSRDDASFGPPTINRNEDTRLVDREPYRLLALEIAALTHRLDEAGIDHNMYNLRKMGGRRCGSAEAIVERMKSRLWEYTWATVHSGILALPPRSTRVLDFGSGGSTFGYFLAARGYEVHLLDLEDSFGYDLQPAIRRFLGADTVTLHRGPLAAAAFAEGFFDVVFSISVFEHMVPALPRTLVEIARVLRPGGVLASTVNFNLVRYDAGDYAPLHGHWPLDLYLLDALERQVPLRRLGNPDVHWDARAEGVGYYRVGGGTSRCGGNPNRPFFNIALFYQRSAETLPDADAFAEEVFGSLPYTIDESGSMKRRRGIADFKAWARARMKIYTAVVASAAFVAGAVLARLALGG